MSIPKSVTLTDLEQRNGAILRCSTKFSRFGGQLRQSGERYTHTVCDKNVVQKI